MGKGWGKGTPYAFSAEMERINGILRKEQTYFMNCDIDFVASVVHDPYTYTKGTDALSVKIRTNTAPAPVASFTGYLPPLVVSRVSELGSLGNAILCKTELERRNPKRDPAIAQALPVKQSAHRRVLIATESKWGIDPEGAYDPMFCALYDYIVDLETRFYMAILSVLFTRTDAANKAIPPQWTKSSLPADYQKLALVYHEARRCATEMIAGDLAGSAWLRELAVRVRAGITDPKHTRVARCLVRQYNVKDAGLVIPDPSNPAGRPLTFAGGTTLFMVAPDIRLKSSVWRDPTKYAAAPAKKRTKAAPPAFTQGLLDQIKSFGLVMDESLDFVPQELYVRDPAQGNKRRPLTQLEKDTLKLTTEAPATVRVTLTMGLDQSMDVGIRLSPGLIAFLCSIADLQYTPTGSDLPDIDGIPSAAANGDIPDF
jgi:hypothetical protein